MEHTPPPLFKQGPSALVRLLVFVLIAAALFISDARYRTLETLRETLGTGLYPLQRVALLPREAVRNIVDFLIATDRLRLENRTLKADNLRLAQQALSATQLAIENNHLRALLQLKARMGSDAIPAEIQYDAKDPFSHKVIIDRGARHGVRLSAPVINEKGILGQVTRIYMLHSEVTLLSDEKLAVPVQVVRTGMHSLLYGMSRGDSLNMRFVPIHTDVQPGDELVTSGLDGMIPPGLPVAKVLKVERPVGAEFAQVVCVPVTPVRGERQVLVLDDKNQRPQE